MRAAESQASTAGFPTPRGGIPAHCVTLGVVYCTGNAGKFREASHVFDEWNASGSPLKVAYLQMDADPVEIQGTDEEVCRVKVEAATKNFARQMRWMTSRIIVHTRTSAATSSPRTSDSSSGA